MRLMAAKNLYNDLSVVKSFSSHSRKNINDDTYNKVEDFDSVHFQWFSVAIKQTNKILLVVSENYF